MTLDTVGGNDLITASTLANDRAALTLKSGTGSDRVIGSRFEDVIDSGTGADFVTGGLALDLFSDASPEGEIDTLVEKLDFDMGLFNDKFLMGTLQNASGSGPFAVGKNPANELIDAGDRWAAASAPTGGIASRARCVPASACA